MPANTLGEHGADELVARIEHRDGSGVTVLAAVRKRKKSTGAATRRSESDDAVLREFDTQAREEHWAALAVRKLSRHRAVA